MKVLQVLPGLQSGGVEKGTLEIAQALVQAGHESWVLSAGGGLVPTLEQQGSRHITWDLGRKSPLTLLQVRKLRRWLQENPFDIVHVRSRMPAWVVYLAWKKMPPATRPHLVSSVHGLHSVSRYSEIMTCGERVIVVSNTARQYVVDNYPRTEQNKLRLIFRGVEPNLYPYGYQADTEWRNRWYEQFPQLQGKRVVTLPGRITRLKGHIGFLNIIQSLRTAGHPVMGLIVGGDDPKRLGYRQEINRAMADLSLQESIVFTGQRSDIRDIYSVSDAVLSLSTKPESFGRTVLEALSMGVPVVGYDHGGVGEILQVLYPQGAVPLMDEGAVVNAVAAVLKGQCGAVQHNDRFLLSNMQQQTLAVYDELVTS